jgi:hypothetical protein
VSPGKPDQAPRSEGVSESPQAFMNHDPNLTPAATVMSPIALPPLLKRRGVACLRLASSGRLGIVTGHRDCGTRPSTVSSVG